MGQSGRSSPSASTNFLRAVASTAALLTRRLHRRGKQSYAGASPGSKPGIVAGKDDHAATRLRPAPRASTSDCSSRTVLLRGPSKPARVQPPPTGRSSHPADRLAAASQCGTRASSVSAGIPQALPKGKKLILADGSFQIVREYQRQGDRVRYYSVERSDWEEIPASLVDWAATQKARSRRRSRETKSSPRKIQSQRASRALCTGIDSDRSLEIRPGVILPDDAGLYLLDGKKVYTLEQDLAVSRINKGREVARIATGVPLIPSKHIIELPGKSAKLRIHSGDPEFYFRPVDGRDAHLSLLRLDVNADKREVEKMSTNIANISSYKNQQISLLSWDAARGVTRLTVDEKLQPGEYAIVENRPDGEVDLSGTGTSARDWTG